MNDVDSLSRHVEVHVWAVWLKASPPVNRAYRCLLSPHEMARADRFVFEHLTRSHELSQGALRLLLAHSLKCQPGDVAFRFGPRGKPMLQGDSRMRFNMAHSGSLALYAITVDCEIGVDVEELRDIPELEQVASHYFSKAEALQLLSIADEMATREAFYRCWTRKEAYIKAVGDGLYLPLDQFQVTLLSDAPAKFIHIGDDSAAAAEWTLQHLDPAPNYFGALAYHAAPRNIVFHEPLKPEQLLNGIWSPRSRAGLPD
jgi:4'-phosphopantetheinyl transferase